MNNIKHKIENNVVISKAVKGIENLYSKLEKYKNTYEPGLHNKRNRTMNTIQNIKRLDLPSEVKCELESMLYCDLEEGDKHKFFPN